MQSLKEYLKDFREVNSSANCTDEELLDYSVKHIRSFLKSKITEELQGAEQVDVSTLWSIIDNLK